MPRRIVNITELSKMAGRHPTRLSRLVAEGRLSGDYIDGEGFHYWTPREAKRIVGIIEEHERQGKAGRGVKLVLTRKKRLHDDAEDNR